MVGLFYCKNCGDMGVVMTLNPWVCLDKVKTFFRQTRMHRIKARLKGNVIAYFPKSHVHDVEYTFYQEGGKIIMESYCFHYIPSKRLEVKEFNTYKQLEIWLDDIIPGYHLCTEGVEWARKLASGKPV